MLPVITVIIPSIQEYLERKPYGGGQHHANKDIPNVLLVHNDLMGLPAQEQDVLFPALLYDSFRGIDFFEAGSYPVGSSCDPAGIFQSSFFHHVRRKTASSSTALQSTDGFV